MEVDAVFVVLELLDRRRKPARLERPPPPPPLLLIPPEKAPPPLAWLCGPEACRVGYNLAAEEQKEEAEAGRGKDTDYIEFVKTFQVAHFWILTWVWSNIIY